MKAVALISGGKDSCHAMFLAQQHGHEIVALANLLPRRDQPDELNSFMYQTVGHQLVEQYATCMNLPLYRKHIQGSSAKQDMQYTHTEGDEVEDLFILLSYVKECIPGIGAVTSGAIASDYQRLRVEHVCARLNLVSLAYLWHQPQRQLLRDMIESGLHAVLVKVAALGLLPERHLGKSLEQLEPHLLKLNALYGSHVCGEGGEYESLTLDSPIFTHARIVIDASEVVVESFDSMAPVAFMRPTAFHTESKPMRLSETLSSPAGVSDFRRSNTISWDGALGSSAMHSPKLTKMASWSRHSAPVFPTVHIVPSDYIPPAAVPRDVSRSSVERRPGLCSVHLRSRQHEDYMQVTCWAVLGSQQQALSSDITENDTVVALMDMFTALQHRIKEAGLQLGHALYVHLLLGNMGHFAAANNMYCRTFPACDPPSRTCIQLPLPVGVPVMLDVLLALHCFKPQVTAVSCHPASAPSSSIALRPHNSQCNTISPPSSAIHLDRAASLICELPQDVVDNSDGGQPPTHMPKRVMHVQSISSWAPSCIGPYSQATAYDGLVYGAGAIPLQPSSMTVLPGSDPAAQTLCALKHVQTVSIALRTCALRAAVSLTVYYCQSIGPAGLEQVRQAMSSALNDGLPSPVATQGSKRQVGPDGLEVSDDEDEDGDDVYESAAEDSPLDAYMTPALVRNCVRSNVVYVAVPALPRGCLVEVQPLLLDCAWMESRAPGPSSSSGTSCFQAAEPATDPQPPADASQLPADDSQPPAEASQPAALQAQLRPALGAIATAAAASPSQPLLAPADQAQLQAPADSAVAASLAASSTSSPTARHASEGAITLGTSPGPVDLSFSLNANSSPQVNFNLYANSDPSLLRHGIIPPDAILPQGAGARSDSTVLPGHTTGRQGNRLSLTQLSDSAARHQQLDPADSGPQPQLGHAGQPLQPAIQASSLSPARGGQRLQLQPAQSAEAGLKPPAGSLREMLAQRSYSHNAPGASGSNLARHVIQLGHMGAGGSGSIHHRTLTPDSCRASVCSSVDQESCVSSPDVHHPQGREGAGGGAASGGDVMVTTVHCRQFGVLKSLYHLPADVFMRPSVNKRLQLAVNGVLDSYGVKPSHLVQLRAWYDIHQVPEDVASQLFTDCVEGWHINWMPVLNISTTVCEAGSAAVLELLAKFQ